VNVIPESALPGRAGWLPGVALLALLGAVYLLYWPGLHGELLLDDQTHLETMAGIETGELGWWEALTRTRTEDFAGLVYRPISVATLLVNWVASAGSLWSFKYTNLMIHLLTGTLVFWLAGRLLTETSPAIARRRWWLALWVAAAWLTAPLYVSTVLYIIQRMAELAALFTFAGLVAYTIGRQNLDRRFGTGVAGVVLCFAVFWPAAFLSKENGVLLPALAFVVEAFFFHFEGNARTRRLVRWLFGVLVALGALATLAVVTLRPDWILDRYSYRPFTLPERVLTETRILFVYLSQLLIPRGSRMGVHQDDFPLSEGLLDPPSTALAALAWLAAVAASLRWRRGPAGWLLFGPAFYLTGHLVESTVLPLELYFEHRSYIPGFGVFLSLGVGLFLLLERLELRRVLVVLVAIVPLVYAAAAYQRIQVWRTWGSILLVAEHTHPDSVRLNIDLASFYAHAGDLERSREHLDRVVELDRHKAAGAALFRLLAHCMAGAPIDAEEYDKLAAAGGLGDDTYTMNALTLITRFVEQDKCPQLDVPRLADVVWRFVQTSGVDRQPYRDWSMHVHTAKLLRAAGRREDALAAVARSLALRSSSVGARMLEFELLLETGQIERARAKLAWLSGRKDDALTRYRLRIEQYESAFEQIDEIDPAGSAS